MRYFKDPNPIDYCDGVAVDFYEVSGDLIMRQLTVFKDSIESSNVDLVLGDKPFDYETIVSFHDIEEISVEEFEAAWRIHLDQHAARWAEAKAAFPVGSAVVGCITIFFPQGVIVTLGSRIFGVADYAGARATTMASLYPRMQLTGVVAGYDEANQWIKLDSPHVFAERTCDPYETGGRRVEWCGAVDL